jgi:hypothetical protein
LRDGRSAIRALFLKEDPERTEEVAKIEGTASEQKEQRKESGGGALNQAFNDRVISIIERIGSGLRPRLGSVEIDPAGQQI